MEDTNKLTNMGIDEGQEIDLNDTRNETKNEKFIRLAEYRINKIMVAVGSLDKLHNKNSYEYTDEQVNAMFESLEKQLAEVKSHFAKTKMQEAKFSFEVKVE